MSEQVIIIGASGHGKVVADIIMKSGDTVLGFLDDDETLAKTFVGFPVLGKTDTYRAFPNAKFVIAIGNAKVRERIAEQLNGSSWYTAIHPTAVIAMIDTFIGEGTVIMANAVVNSGTYIGRHCIINTSAVVEHDNVMEDFVHIAVGAKSAGTVHVGKRTWIGIGAAVSNNLTICEDCMIGAGTVVIKSIKQSGTYVGVPARRVE